MINFKILFIDIVKIMNFLFIDLVTNINTIIRFLFDIIYVINMS